MQGYNDSCDMQGCNETDAMIAAVKCRVSMITGEM